MIEIKTEDVDQVFSTLTPERRRSETSRAAVSPPIRKEEVERTREQTRTRLTLALFAAALLVVNAIGAVYYLSPISVRVRHPLHTWFKPSGYAGQTLGIVAAVLFLYLWLYPLRKKFALQLSFTGRISGWLNWHIVAGLVVPWIAATHAGWRFTGMIGLGYASMFIVYLSGLVGRYLYTRIPRRQSGAAMTLDEVAAEREQILMELRSEPVFHRTIVQTALAPQSGSFEGLGPLGTIRTMVADDVARRNAARVIMAQLPRADASASRIDREKRERALLLARREMALAQQIRMLGATQRVFGLWHALHKPFAVTAFVAVLAHIIVAIAMGATWFG